MLATEYEEFSIRKKKTCSSANENPIRSVEGWWWIPWRERRVDGRRRAMRPFSRASVASCPAFRLTRRNLCDVYPRRILASQGGGGGGLSVGTVLRPVDSVGESNASAWPDLTSSASSSPADIAKTRSLSIPSPYFSFFPPSFFFFFSPKTHFRICDSSFRSRKKEGKTGVKMHKGCLRLWDQNSWNCWWRRNIRCFV